MRWSFTRPDEAVDSMLAALSAARLADEFLESYVCWREACEAVKSAYEHWRRGQRHDRDLAFAAYNAALDQEERAALAFRQHAARVCAAQR